MTADSKVPHKEEGPSGVRVGVWLTVIGLVCFGIVIISLQRRSMTRSASRGVSDGVAPSTELASRDPAGVRTRYAPRWHRPAAPEFVYQGKTLTEWIADLHGDNQPTRQAAWDAFEAMGADASPAIPQLAELLNSSPNQNATAWALALIGTNSLPTMIDALTNGNPVARLEVAGAIVSLRQSPEVGAAIPALVACLKYDDPAVPVRGNALAALHGIANALRGATRRPEIAVPGLVSCLESPEASVRASAANVLEEYGRDAVAAIPVLLRLAQHDENERVRGSAASALQKIAPE